MKKCIAKAFFSSQVFLGIGILFLLLFLFAGEAFAAAPKLSIANLLCDTSLPAGPAIRLNWTASTGANSYAVYRNGNLYAHVLATDLTFYNSANLIAGQSYSYFVRAKNAAGNVISDSNTVNVSIPIDICGASIPKPLKPNAPSNLVAVGSSNNILMNWNDNSSNETGFRIERKVGQSGTYSQIAQAGQGTAAYQDSGLLFGTTYCYVVSAYNAGGPAPSNESCATVLATPMLSSPVHGATMGENSVTLQWNAVAGANGYKANLGTSCGANILLNGSTPVPSITVTALANGVYFWQVQAVSLIGNTGGSASSISDCRSLIVKIASAPVPALSVTPSNQNVSPTAGSAAFNVVNASGGTMNWTASVMSGSSWLSVLSGASGVNSGAITVQYAQNNGSSPRTAEVTVTASGATGSPNIVKVVQAASPPDQPVVNPQVSVSPTSGQTGTAFSELGNGFTSNGTATLHLRKPDGVEYPALQKTTSAQGRYDHSWTAPSDAQIGAYQYWAVDDATGKTSSSVSFEVKKEFLPAADLVIENFTIDKQSVNAGDTVKMQFVFRNRGGAASQPFSVRVLLASNNNLTSGRELFSGSISFPSINPNSFRGWYGDNYLTPFIPVDTQTGTYQIGILTDNDLQKSLPITVTGTAKLPGAFSLNYDPPRCYNNAPAVRLYWDNSSGADSYAVYRNGNFYANTGMDRFFDNTANTAAGQTYTYYVQAKNASGPTNSNSVIVSVPSNICTPTAASSKSLPVILTVAGIDLKQTLLPGDFSQPFRDPMYLQSSLISFLKEKNLSNEVAPIDVFLGWQDGDIAGTKTAVENLKKDIQVWNDYAKKRGAPFNIVAHSWGTVLTYAALTELANAGEDIHVENLFTLGSPIGYMTDSKSHVIHFVGLPKDPNECKITVNLREYTGLIRDIQYKICLHAPSSIREQKSVVIPQNVNKQNVIKHWYNYQASTDIFAPTELPFSQNSSMALYKNISVVDEDGYTLPKSAFEEYVPIYGNIKYSVMSLYNMFAVSHRQYYDWDNKDGKSNFTAWKTLHDIVGKILNRNLPLISYPTPTPSPISLPVPPDTSCEQNLGVKCPSPPPDIIPDPSRPATPITDGDLIKTKDNPDVYVAKLINGKKFKRLILSPNVFNSYGHLRWENVKTVDESVIDQYATINLVRADGDAKVYELFPDGDDGIKRWIKTAAGFISKGFDWDSIYIVNKTDRDSYREME